MNVVELSWIKAKQREFLARFGKKLEVDFSKMKGLEENTPKQEIPQEKKVDITKQPNYKEKKIEEWLNTKAEELGVDLEELRSIRKLSPNKHQKEYLLLKEFSQHAINNNWSLSICAERVNKHRTSLLYHSSEEKRNRKSEMKKRWLSLNAQYVNPPVKVH